jgi:hypothetical protein
MTRAKKNLYVYKCVCTQAFSPQLMLINTHVTHASASFTEATEPQTVPASGFFLTEAAEPHIEIRLPC